MDEGRVRADGTKKNTRALLRISPPLLNRPQLSAREREVLEGIKAGHETRAIATRLRISERTVRFHVERLLIKLRAKTRAQAIENYYASHGPSFTAAQHDQTTDSVSHFAVIDVAPDASAETSPALSFSVPQPGTSVR